MNDSEKTFCDQRELFQQFCFRQSTNCCFQISDRIQKLVVVVRARVVKHTVSVSTIIRTTEKNVLECLSWLLAVTRRQHDCENSTIEEILSEVYSIRAHLNDQTAFHLVEIFVQLSSFSREIDCDCCARTMRLLFVDVSLLRSLFVEQLPSRSFREEIVDRKRRRRRIDTQFNQSTTLARCWRVVCWALLSFSFSSEAIRDAVAVFLDQLTMRVIL